MKNLRGLVLFFAAACFVFAMQLWVYRPDSLRVVGLALAIWFVVGLGSAAVELAKMPTDSTVPKHYRVAGKVFRGIVATTVLVVLGITVFGAWRAHAA